MVKNNTVKDNLNNISQGILNTLEDSIKPENSVRSKVENNSTVDNENSSIVNYDKNKSINNDKNKRVKTSKEEEKDKNKRSFMLNGTAIQQLKMLNLALDSDLSELIINAIDLYYRKNEKKVEQVILNMFNTLKK